MAFRQKSFTEGAIGSRVLLFALPLLGSSFIQQMYSTVDLIYVGNMIDKDATAAVGASSMIITCIVGFFTGLSVGTSVLAARAVGAEDREKLDRIVHTGMTLSLVGGAILTVLGIALSRPALVLLDTPADILELAITYMRIYLLCMVPMSVYNMNAGIIRSMGDSASPMFMQLFGGIANIFLDYGSIRILGMGVDGVAWATMLSQGLSAVLSVLYLMYRAGDVQLRLKKLRLHWPTLSGIFRLGIPAGLQSMVITLSNVFIQYKINGFGVDAIAAFTAYWKVELLLYLPIVALGQSMMTFAGQNIGAGNVKRVEKGVHITIFMGLAYTVLGAALLLVFARPVCGLFTRDEAVLADCLRIIRVTFPFYWLYVILEVLADTIRGVGQSVLPMVVVLINLCVVRTILLVAFTHFFPQIEAVASVYPSAWFLTAACLLFYWISKGGPLKAVDRF